MKIDSTLALYLVFVAQIFIGSLVLPNRFILPFILSHKKRERAQYKAANIATAAVGIAILVTMCTSNFFDSMTRTMLAIGGLFLVQIAPLSIAAKVGAFSRTGSDKPSKRPSNNIDKKAFALQHFVHPAVPFTACSLAIAYFAMGAIVWRTHPIQLGIFAGFNLILIALVTLHLRKLANAKGSEVFKKMDEAQKVIPALVFLSIFLSVYYIFKHGLISTGMHELRPIVMSVFIQALTVMLFVQLKRHIKGCPTSRTSDSIGKSRFAGTTLP